MGEFGMMYVLLLEVDEPGAVFGVAPLGVLEEKGVVWVAGVPIDGVTAVPPKSDCGPGAGEEAFVMMDGFEEDSDEDV